MARNIIAGVNTGIEIFAPQSPLNSTAGSMIWGNYIGTDVTGEVALGNQVGVYINTALSNMIGGPTALPGTGRGNVISGNLIGIYLLASTTMGNQIQGNLIGLDAAGKAPLGNYIGIFLNGASNNTIGGPTPKDRNVIAGNAGTQGQSAGVYFFAGAAGNVVRGNFIGTNATGNKVIGRCLRRLLYNVPNNSVLDRSNSGTTGSRTMGSPPSACSPAPWHIRAVRVLTDVGRVRVRVTGIPVWAGAVRLAHGPRVDPRPDRPDASGSR